VKVSGPHARAITAAYDDWLAYQAKEKLEWGRTEPEDGGDSGDDRPEAFQFWVYLDDAGTQYVVVVEPKPEACIPNGYSSGGGAIYDIDAKTFEILNRQIQE
jgi:hypothetical protein